jgi:hypothetical protein
MEKLSSVLFGKKLNYTLSVVWLFLIVESWFPRFGTTTKNHFKPIWTLEVDEYGNNWLNDRYNLFPSTDIFIYSNALITTLMAVIFILQAFTRIKTYFGNSFEKVFLYLVGLMAVTGGWYRVDDYDTDVLVNILKQFIFGLYLGLNNGSNDQVFVFFFSLTFWLVILRIVVKRRQRIN